MNLTAPSSLPRALVVTVMMLSWLVLSNHCALGLMGSAAAPKQHAGCCGKDDSTTNQPASAPLVRECCQSLQALAPAAAFSVPTALVADAAPLWLSPVLLLAQPAWISRQILPFETGPPDSRSFAELVLQRSLRSHAPPAVG